MTPYASRFPSAAYLNYRDLDLGTNKGLNASQKEASCRGKKSHFVDNFERLIAVKMRVDPDNFFGSEQSIPSE
ncbi:hypothetical protein MLD38_010368 [Melastoma candidum]|uniref:Uncharacterized protein n=1 Tax=Melastoma candidum TaxID=119954 RepID=A0ACB9QZ72_9MYRT|nr:hypothetical protein MLD38_010368 [Melastoma candidum]